LLSLVFGMFRFSFFYVFSMLTRRFYFPFPLDSLVEITDTGGRFVLLLVPGLGLTRFLGNAESVTPFLATADFGFCSSPFSAVGLPTASLPPSNVSQSNDAMFLSGVPVFK